MDGPEKYMVRRVEPGWLNLAIGEPVALQLAAGPLYPDAARLRIRHENDLRYPDPRGMPLELPLYRDEEHETHQVVTNGAKQALAAAMYALRTCRGTKHITAPAPHWPSFPTLARATGLIWGEPLKSLADTGADILTLPNNPTGNDPDLVIAAGFSPTRPRIWDAAYASPVYGYAPRLLEYDIGVGSASKLFGLSGLRIGWLWTRHRDLAAAAAEYVEATTAGVSTASQRYLEAFLDEIRHFDEEWEVAQRRARLYMECNATDWTADLGEHMDWRSCGGLLVKAGGMFGWFRADDPGRWEAACKKAKVRLVPGQACGVTEAGWYRVNLGAHRLTVRNAADRLRRELVR